MEQRRQGHGGNRPGGSADGANAKQKNTGGIRTYKKDSEVSYALGAAPAFELLKKLPGQARRVFIHSSWERGAASDELFAICRSLGIEPEERDKAFSVLSQKENCFVIGEFEKYRCSLDPSKPHIVLVNPSNSGNLGTIMRTALGFGVRDIAIITPAVDMFDPKTVRASMGAIFSLRTACFSSFDEYLASDGCGAEGRALYPFMLKAKTALGAKPLQKRCSLIFGNEATGLPDSFLGVGESVIIRHSHEIDSLNLPMAVGIALYELNRET